MPCSTTLAGEDKDFVAARSAYQKGDAGRLNAALQRLEGSLLEPYAIYWQIKLNLTKAAPEEINAFLARYGDGPLADRLRSDWLKQEALRGHWVPFATEFAKLVEIDTELRCYSWRWRPDGKETALSPEVRALWFTGNALPASCDPLFEAMLRNATLSEEDVWARIRLALEAGQISVATRVAQYLPQSDADFANKLNAASDNPQRYLGKAELRNRWEREAALFAVYRIARSQPHVAERHWRALSNAFSESDQRYLWGQLAYCAARLHDPVTLHWYANASGATLNDAQLAWKARIALREHAWPEVVDAVDAMSHEEHDRSVWRYWKARAYIALAMRKEANALLAPLSTEPGFYGQLAGEELGTVMGNPSASYKAGREDIDAIAALPGIRRALALYRLDMRVDANREWRWATQRFTDPQLLAAAELARQQGWNDRAINTALQTSRLHDFDLRFMAPHRDIVQNYANHYRLDEAWVYGLIRQESRFAASARSSAGAAGLMQLMPATARWVAKHIGFKDYRSALIDELETNIALGTYYLRYMLDKLDGLPVLATAAYNAGPQRARKWQDARTIEGAVYVESIPFKETREYVQKVMSNVMYYAERFGQQPQSLKSRLGTVTARDTAPAEES
ncbi:MAG: transglycosylase SLT domain-containing protein [Burkholderiales bacterium]